MVRTGGAGPALGLSTAWSLRGPQPQRSRASSTAASTAAGRAGRAGRRPAGPVGQRRGGVGVEAGQPLEGGLAADAVAAGGLGDGQAGGADGVDQGGP